MNITDISRIYIPNRPAVFDWPDAKKKLGLIVLSTDLTSESDFTRMIPAGQAGLYVTRVAYQNPVMPGNLREMASRLTEAADLILPGESLDAICYSCTAASVVIGERKIENLVCIARPRVPVVTPTRAARLAFHALGVRRVAILTPYQAEVGAAMARHFVEHGVEVVGLTCMNIKDDRRMARVSRKTIIDLACGTDTPEAEALFISCTGLRSLCAVEYIERRTGKPVVTSNQASIWAMLNYAGIENSSDPGKFGRLFNLSLPQGKN